MTIEDQRFVIARIGEAFMAFDIRAIKEVVALQQPMQTQRLIADRFIEIPYRDQTLKVVHPGLSLDLDLSVSPRRYGSAIVIESRSHRIGLYTDEVTCILKGAQLEVHNKLFNFSQNQRKSIQQIFEFKDRQGQALLIDVDQFLQGFEEQSWFAQTEVSDQIKVATTDKLATIEHSQNLCLRFDIGEHHLRVPIHQVERILPFGRLNHFASAPRHVLGLRHVEGNVIAVVDWLVRLDEETAKEPYRRILIFHVDGSWYGVGAHRVRDIISMSEIKNSSEAWEDLNLSLLEVAQSG